MTTGDLASILARDVKTGLVFLTRFPVGHDASGADVARACWSLPVVGALVGAFGALIYWLAHSLGLPPFVSATLAVGATMLITGCLHEDGLADTADGFGGGSTAERKLAIMRDSRIGAYGASALALSLMLRAGAIASLIEPELVALALIAAHAGARAAMPALMRFVPRARQDGLAADAGRPPRSSVIAAALSGTLVLVLCLGAGTGSLAVLSAIAAIGLMAWLALRQVGGQTGDVLGALEQIAEILILLVAAARL